MCTDSLSEELKDLTTLSQSTGLNHMSAKGTCRLQYLKKMRTRTEEMVNKRNLSIQNGRGNHQVHVQDH